MDLLNRYLQAVEFWLPKAQRLDISAELSEDIRSQIEERETELGRKLNEPEVEAIFKRLGHPLLMANRYAPQRHLIGPVLFPIYVLVLKIVALCYLVPWVLVWAGFMIFDAGYRAQHSGHALIGSLASLWGTLALSALAVLGMVTVVFAVLEKVQAESNSRSDWDPRKLPAVHDPARISRFSSIFELEVSAIFCVWWIGMREPVVNVLSAVQITFAPVWLYFFWGFLALGLINMVMSGANLLRPYWTRTRAVLRLVIDAASSVLFCWLCKVEIFAAISVPNLSGGIATSWASTVNTWLLNIFPLAVGVGAIIAVADVYRIFHISATDAQVSRSVAASH